MLAWFVGMCLRKGGFLRFFVMHGFQCEFSWWERGDRGECVQVSVCKHLEVYDTASMHHGNEQVQVKMEIDEKNTKNKCARSGLNLEGKFLGIFLQNSTFCGFLFLQLSLNVLTTKESLFQLL